MKKRTLILSLVISCCFILFLCSAKNSQAETKTVREDRLCLYQEKTQTLILKGKGADTAEEIANGYKLVSYEYAKTKATIHHGIVGAGVTELEYEDIYDLFEDVETLVIGDSVTATACWITSHCTKLKSITIGDGMTALPEYFLSPDNPFINSNLETVILGKSIRTIGDYAFNRCIGLKNIEADPENPYLKIEKKGLYSKDGKKLYAYPVAADGEPVIVPGTQEISPVVFAYSHVTSIEIPASVRALSGGLFEHCKQLEKFTFAENSQCVLTETSSSWAEDMVDEKGIFAGCTRLKEVRFGENFQKLAPDTFKNSAVRSIYLGKSFQGVTKSGEKKIGKVFSWDLSYGPYSVFPSIEQIEISKQNPYFKVKKGALLSKDGKKLYAYPGGRKNTSYTVPASVETITEGAFCAHKYLRKVHTGKNTKTIGKFAFEHCTKLKQVSLGKKIKTLKVGAFEECHMLNTIVNLEKVKKIEKYALLQTEIIYVPDRTTHEYPATVRGNVMYFYTKGSKKTTWSVIKGKKCVKILKRYKNSARIKVKFKKKGYVVIRARQGNKKIKYDFYVD